MPNFPASPFHVEQVGGGRPHYRIVLGDSRAFVLQKPPSPDPKDKRHAVLATAPDRPFEESASAILWDRGTCTEVQHEYGAGKLLFDFKGVKLRGLWTFIRTSRDWLLIKETADAHVRRGGSFPGGSIVSGFTLEELSGAARTAGEVCEELQRAGAARKRVPAADVQPMLAEYRPKAFSDPRWVFELKYDGFRAISAREGGRGCLHYRRGSESSLSYPDLCASLKALPYEHLVMDGEIVVLDEKGRPSFQRLQKRALLTAPNDLSRAALEFPATLFVFDLLAFGDFDARPLPLELRKRLLRRLLPASASSPLRYVEHIEEQGEAMFRSVRDLGLEGVVAKRKDSPYRAGRQRDWIKLRVDRTAEFAAVGFTPPEGSRTGFGALHLAFREEDSFVYAGRAGSGFAEEELDSVRKDLERDRVPRPVCKGPLPPGRGHVWVKPRRVVEVRYKEITEDGLLRAPVFLRFRDDRSPEDCVRPEGVAAAPEPPGRSGPGPKVVPSNVDKVFWPEEGFTKGDLLGYYRAIAPWLLPYLRDRPVVLTRFPDGIAGKSFFQKDAPGHVPDWIRTHRMRTLGGWHGYGSKEAAAEPRDIDHFVCDDVDSLLYVVNLGTIPLHIYAARAATDRADWCIIDLDPKEAPFEWVVRLARATHELCDEIGLPNFCKTSGQKGLHVLLPLAQQCTEEQARDLGVLLAHAIEQRHPDISTTVRAPLSARKGKVYLDALQNGPGKTIAAPFSARPVPGATVSMPLKWSEVNAKLDPKDYTLKTAPARMKRLRKDPMAEVLTLSPDLAAALEALSQRLG
ncbi:MAG TPA: DNA ligase D [Myxococcales bacterium]|nr:DNA ligase D [Myxococcales bacterium]